MKILLYGALSIVCVFLSLEINCDDGVYRQKRASGTNEDDKIVAEAPAAATAAENEKELYYYISGWKFLGSTTNSITSLKQSSLKETIITRNIRCYDKSAEDETSQEVVTVKYLSPKWPAWAGTLYHHRILHPYHDWNNTGITGDPWNHGTHI